MVENIFILNESLRVVCMLSNSGDNPQLSFWDDKYVQYLNTGADVYTVNTFLTPSNADYLKGKNYILFRFQNEYKLFQITECNSYHKEGHPAVELYAETIGLRLKNDTIRAITFDGNAKYFFEQVLVGTKFEVGYISPTLESNIQKVEVTKPTEIYKVIQDNLATYNMEIAFRVGFENNRVSKLYIDAYAEGERGSKKYNRFEYGENVSGIEKTEDWSEFCTALVGVGANGLTFTDLEFEPGEGLPITKPGGQDWLADDVANDLYNNGEKYIVKTYETNDTDKTTLMENTYKELQRVCKPHNDYKVDLSLNKNAYKDIKIGDTNYVVDNDFCPPVRLEARVGELELSFSDHTKNKCTLSNYKKANSQIDLLTIKGMTDYLKSDKTLSEKDIERIREYLRTLFMEEEEIEEIIKRLKYYFENPDPDPSDPGNGDSPWIKLSSIDNGLWLGDKRIYDIKKHKSAGIEPGETPKPEDPGNSDLAKEYAAAVKYYAKFDLGKNSNSSSLAKIMDPSNKYKIPTLVDYWSEKFGLDPALVYCLIMAESSGSPYCATKSSGGGYGIMQCERAAYFNKKQTVKFLDGTTKTFTPSYSTMKPYGAGNIVINGVTVDKNISNQIMFGCNEFRKSLERFQYNIFASLVGYNFGLYGCDLCICKYVAEKNGLSWVNKYGYTAQSKAVQELYFKELSKLTFAWANERKWYKQVKKAGTPNNVELYLRWYKSKDGQLPYTLDKNGNKKGYGANKPSTSTMTTNTTISTVVQSSSTQSTSVMTLAASTTTKYVTVSSLNIRSGPGTSYSILGTFTTGDKVEVISESDGWAKINYNGGTAYVSSQYIATYSTPGIPEDDGKYATAIRNKIVAKAKEICELHQVYKKATYNGSYAIYEDEKRYKAPITYKGIKNPYCYVCSSLSSCAYHYAGLDSVVGWKKSNCANGNLVRNATEKSGYILQKLTAANIDRMVAGDLIMFSLAEVPTNLTRAWAMAADGSDESTGKGTHHVVVYCGKVNGKHMIAHASKPAYPPNSIRYESTDANYGNSYLFKYGIWLRPWELAQKDKEAEPVKPPTDNPQDPGEDDPGEGGTKPIVPEPDELNTKGLPGITIGAFYNGNSLVQNLKVDDLKDDDKYPTKISHCLLVFGVGNLSEAAINDYKALVQILLKKYPKKPIFIAKEYYVGSSFPNATAVNEQIDNFNMAMKEFADNTSYVVILNVPNELLATNGVISSQLSNDGFSMKDKASTDIYYNAYKKALLSYNARDIPVKKYKPVINGVENKIIRVGTTFNANEGVTATDKEDGDLTSKIQVTGTVDTSTANEYTLTYSVTDKDNNTTTVTRVIKVVNDNKPIINGATNKNIEIGKVFNPKDGVTASDLEDGNLTDSIVITGTVDVTIEGEYTLTYSVTDKDNNTTTVTRVITVVSKDEPPGEDPGNDDPGEGGSPPSGDDPKPEDPKPKVIKSIVMKAQQTYKYGVVDDMTMKLPSAVVQTFFSKLTFTTCAANPKFNQSKILYLTGDHCKNGALIVKPSYQYVILTYYNPDTSQSKYAGSVAAYKTGESEEVFKNFRGAKDIPTLAANWIANKSKFQYAYSTVTSFTNPDANKSKWKVNGLYNIDCSTLSGLMMRGYSYSTSPYAKKATSLKKNPNYSWAFNLPRTAADQAKYCIEKGWVLNGIDMTDFSNVPVGALIFYDRDSKLLNRFMACSHVAICVGKDSNGVNRLIESTTDSNGGIRYKAIKDNTPDKILFIALPQIF